MANNLEKTFFDTFRIEPEKGCTAYDKFTEEEADAICNDKCAECSYLDDVYPQITDRILLELIRIIGLITIKYTNEQCEICYGNGTISYLGKDLKEAILNLLISKVSIFKQKVRTLFKEDK